MQKTTVCNMVSSKGNKIPNQFIIRTPEGCYFQSYDSTIVFQNREGKTFLDEKYWDYSVTTGKYRNMFLGESKADTLKKIDSGEYVLTDLNKGR